VLLLADCQGQRGVRSGAAAVNQDSTPAGDSSCPLLVELLLLAALAAAMGAPVACTGPPLWLLSLLLLLLLLPAVSGGVKPSIPSSWSTSRLLRGTTSVPAAARAAHAMTGLGPNDAHTGQGEVFGVTVHGCAS
jgi:hypothetical protein